MGSYDTSKSRALATGFQAPLGSVSDPDLAARFKGYKRTIASRYRAMTNDDIDRFTPPGKLLVQPKIDGELWFLVWQDGEAWLSNPGGRVVYGDIPVLKEATKHLQRAKGLTIIAGELFAIRKDQRPRHGDLSKAMGGEAQAEVARIGFMAFDLMEGGDATAQTPIEVYADRHEVLTRLFEGGKRVQAIKTNVLEGPAAVQRMYDELVATGKAEGLVLRPPDGRTYKLKPAFTLDAVVIGYTERADEPGVLRSMALALVREDGQFQIIGSCGNMDMDTRKAMYARLSPLEAPSSFRHASNSGALYRFVKPELIIEFKVTDVVADESSGEPILRMVAAYEAEGGWTAVRRMPSVSILHPIFIRTREDKTVDAVDVRMAQLLERVVVPELDVHAEVMELPRSELLRREVYTKTTKGKLAVRKLVMWETHKRAVDPSFPAYVVQFTDYSPNRKDPLKREVRLAPTSELANEIADAMIAKNIKKGWALVEAPS